MLTQAASWSAVQVPYMASTLRLMKTTSMMWSLGPALAVPAMSCTTKLLVGSHLTV